MVDIEITGYFGKDNGLESWIKSDITLPFFDTNHGLAYAHQLQANTDKIVLSITNLITNETFFL